MAAGGSAITGGLIFLAVLVGGFILYYLFVSRGTNLSAVRGTTWHSRLFDIMMICFVFGALLGLLWLSGVSMGDVFTNPSKAVFVGLGALGVAFSGVKLAGKESFSKAQKEGAIITISIIFLLFGIALPKGGIRELREPIEIPNQINTGSGMRDCNEVLDQPSTDYITYWWQIKCIMKNPSLMFTVAMMFLTVGGVIMGMIPAFKAYISWPLAAVVTLFLMRQRTILNIYAKIWQYFSRFWWLLLLILGIMFAYIKWKQTQQEKAKTIIQTGGNTS